MLKVYAFLFWLIAGAVVFSGALTIAIFTGEATPLLLIVIAAVAVAMSAGTSLTKKNRDDV